MPSGWVPMKRKKPKRRGREQRMPAATSPAACRVGDRVRVRPGTTDPDFPDVRKRPAALAMAHNSVPRGP